MKFCSWLATFAIVLQVLGNVLLVFADCPDGNYKWENMTKSDDTNLPDPANDSGSQGGGGCSSFSWAITGSKGDFAGNAEAENTGCTIKYDQQTGIHTATGFKEVKMGGWDPGTGNCQPAAPDDARITGQGDATVSAQVHMDANNAFPSLGSCATNATAKVAFTGLASGSIKVELNPSFGEGDTEISGSMTFQKSPNAEVEITGTISSDVADASKADSISLTEDFDGNVAGKLQKGHGTVTVMARANDGAKQSTAEAETQITLVKLSHDEGGTVECEEDTCNANEVGSMSY